MLLTVSLALHHNKGIAKTGWHQYNNELTFFSFINILFCSLTQTVIVFPVSFRVSEASPVTDDHETLFYVFGSKGISIIDPERKTILSKITEADGICTKSNDRFSR